MRVALHTWEPGSAVNPLPRKSCTYGDRDSFSLHVHRKADILKSAPQIEKTRAGWDLQGGYVRSSGFFGGIESRYLCLA